jgi:hypothetical protein
LLAPSLWAQAPTWQSVDLVEETSIAFVATDPSGNVYVAGSFSSTAYFGNIQLTTAGGQDIYVAKWNPLTRTYVWAQQAGGRGDDGVQALVATSSGIYIAGNFYQSGIAGPMTTTIGTTTLTNPYGVTSDGFVAKLTDAGASGSFTWAQRLGGTGQDGVTSLAVTGNSVYAAGLFSGTATFGSTTLSSAGGTDAFLTKFTDAGPTATVGWTQQLGSVYDEVATAVATAGPAVYVAGTFASPTLTCGSTVLTNALVGGSSSDLFVTKLTDAGPTPNINWAQRAGSIGQEQLVGLAVNGSNVYIGGNCYGFSLPIGSFTLPNAGMYDLFVAKLSDAGNTSSFTWAQQVGGYYSERLMSLAAVGNALYLTGEYASNPLSFGATSLPNVSRLASYSDIFVAKLTDNGATSSFTWAQRAGGDAIDEVASIALSGGNIYVAGYAAPPCQFGALTMGTPPYIASYETYLASLYDGAALASTTAQPSLPLTLYPNPAAHTSTLVQVPAVAGVAQVTLTLHDALGRLVRTTTVPLPATGLVHQLPVAGLSRGLYVLRVQAGTITASSRLQLE